ncbi:MAG: excinuclease ABC subunit UvrC [Bdellovibrionota bacterium]
MAKKPKGESKNSEEVVAVPVKPRKHEAIRALVSDFPIGSGVYLMKSKLDKIIYVGKAKNLKSRVRSYFLDSKDLSPKTKLLVTHIAKVEYIVTNTEVEAFLLEASLIKKHRPKYNVRLKDDKTYPYIRFSMADEFPRIYLSRKVKKDGSLYFGPFTSGKAVWATIRFLNHTFQIRDCSDHFFHKRSRPCITYEIGRCTAPCVKFIDKEGYRENVKNAVMFVRGKNKKVIKTLKSLMQERSDQERFEEAARLRDSVYSIEHIMEKQMVVNDKTEIDQDAIQFHGDERGVTIEVLSLRHGRVLGSRSQFLAQINIHAPGEDEREWLVSFINQYYEDNLIPDEVLLPLELGKDMTILLSQVLEARSDKKVSIRYPMDAYGEKILEMAHKNAQEHFKEHVQGSESKLNALYDIQKKFHLPEVPKRIECYDISHFQGAETVASQVVFEDGMANTDQYRRYKLKAVQGINDYDSMKEVLTRRLNHDEWDDPQLILIDGGKGQLNVVHKVLKELGRGDLPVASLAKARTEKDFEKQEVESTQERFFLPGRSNYITFREGSEAYKILTNIRDEAHRFAITYHRKLRENSMLESSLDSIPGLGPKKKLTLLKKFLSIDAIKEATIKEIADLEGFGEALAEEVLLHLRAINGEPEALIEDQKDS